MPYLLPWRASVGLWTMRWSIAASIVLHRIHYPNPLSGNGAAQAFDPLRFDPPLSAPTGWRVDAHRRRAHIHPVTRTPNHAGSRRISLPSSERARAVLIRHHSAEDLSNVVRIAGCRSRL